LQKCFLCSAHALPFCHMFLEQVHRRNRNRLEQISELLAEKLDANSLPDFRVVVFCSIAGLLLTAGFVSPVSFQDRICIAGLLPCSAYLVIMQCLSISSFLRCLLIGWALTRIIFGIFSNHLYLAVMIVSVGCAYTMHLALSMLVESHCQALRAKINFLETTQHRLTAILSTLFDASCYSDKQGTLTCSSPHLQHLLGFDIQTKSLADFADTCNDKARLQSWLAQACTSHHAQQLQVTLRPRHEKGLAQSDLEGPDTGAQPSKLEVILHSIALPEIVPHNAAKNSQIQVSNEQAVELECGELQRGDPSVFIGISVVQEGCQPHIQASCSSPVQHCYSSGSHSLPSSCEDAGSTRLTDDVASTEHQNCNQDVPVLNGTASDTACLPNSGDCLPETALVWVEDTPVPKPLHSIKSNQRILCYDSLARTMRYSKVSGISFAPADYATWVKVNLEDGTSLEMTADHPVEPNQNGKHVRACDLQPMEDTIMVVKMVAVPVASVEPIAPSWSASCALSVQQPSRHTVLVANSKDSSATMAVGSADAERNSPLNYRFLDVKGTFLTEDSPTPLCKHRQRSSSLPPQWDAPLEISATERSFASQILPQGQLHEDCDASTHNDFEEPCFTYSNYLGCEIQSMCYRSEDGEFHQNAHDHNSRNDYVNTSESTFDVEDEHVEDEHTDSSEKSAINDLAIERASESGDDDCSSACSSGSSNTSVFIGYEKNYLTDLILGQQHPPEQQVVDSYRSESGRVIKLSEIERLRQLSIPSIGSMAHFEGHHQGGSCLANKCAPCFFEYKRRTGRREKACWKSFLCERCHLCDIDKTTKPVKKKKMYFRSWQPASGYYWTNWATGTWVF